LALIIYSIGKVLSDDLDVNQVLELAEKLHSQGASIQALHGKLNQS